MSAKRISLSQPITSSARGFIRGLAASGKRRQSELDYHVARLEAARRTLAWLMVHEVEIKAFLALPTEARIAVIGYGAQAINGEDAR